MRLGELAPRRARVVSRRLVGPVGALSAGSRLTPDLLVVGAQRCGTTSLFRALESHPRVFPPVLHKGVNYFDVNYFRGPAWYQGHFPIARLAQMRSPGGRTPLTFEASGYYMFHPLAPERLAVDLPGIKVIAMVRDPVERAYSAHKHETARGFETELFDSALDLEDDRLRGEVVRMRTNPRYQSFSHRHHAYVRRGQYAEQLAVLVGLLGREQVLIVESERFFERPFEEYTRVLDFLGLPTVMPSSFERHNGRPRAPMADDTRDRLRRHFRRHDEDLADLMGRAPAWLG